MSRIEPVATAFAEDRPAKQKRPRIKDEAHLKLIRQLPCIIDGTYPVEAAHIRAACPRLGKRSTGKGEKPDDKWTLPLSPGRHLEQHQGAELAFWERYGIEPFSTALALYAAQGDIEAMEQIVRNARRRPA